METNEENILILDEFYIQFAGTRYCLEFIFTCSSSKEEFTNLMAQKYGETISKKWFFYQKNIHGQTHIPLLGESCFSLDWGHISGLQRYLTQEEIQQAINMVLSVAQEMGIEVKKRNTINLQEHMARGIPKEYHYETLLGPKDNDQNKSTKKQ